VPANLEPALVAELEARGRRVVTERTIRRTDVILAAVRRGLPGLTDAEIVQASIDIHAANRGERGARGG
jgi:hypothetical protein